MYVYGICIIIYKDIRRFGRNRNITPDYKCLILYIYIYINIYIYIYKLLYIYYIYIHKYIYTYFSYVVDIPNMVFNTKSLIKIHKYLFNTN